MTDHLPDCDDFAFSGAGFHRNCARICICRQVRRVEKRILNAAREAIRNREDGEYFPWVQVEIALAAIDALRGEL